MNVRVAVMVALGMALAGCGSSPKTQYFSLSAAPGAGAVKGAIASPLTVAAVHIPPSLDRPELVRSTGANTVDVSGSERWSGPLDEMMRRVLSEDLAAILPPGEIVPPDAPQPPRTAQVVVAVMQFGPIANGEAVLQGSWSLLGAGRSDPLLRRDIRLETPAPASRGQSQAAAMSALLAQLGHEIAADLSQSFPARDRQAAR